MIYKILGLLVNTLTTDDKFSLFNKDNLTQPIEMDMPKKQKKNFIFFRIFEIYLKILNILKKKMTLKAYVFPQLRTANYVLR